MIKTLFVEDTPQDMALLLRVLSKDGLQVEATRVTSLASLEEALRQSWDLILSDYNLPGFTAVEVLQTIKDLKIQTPVIVVSSEVSDETAVELMRHGAADFVRKENPVRLAPAILREVEAAKSRQRIEEVQRVGEKQFQTLADSIPQLAWMAKADGLIFWYNKKWYEYTGTAFGDMQGWGWGNGPSSTPLPKTLSKWKTSLETGEPWEDVFQLKSKSDEYRWFLSRALPIKDSQGKVTGWFGTNTDINEQLKVEAELKTAKAEAEEANLAKTRFLANMSHEIRTPLGVMMGFADLALDQRKWSDEVEHYLKAIKRNGQMLTRVIGEVLDLAKIEASKIEIELIRFNLPSLVEEIYSFLNLQATEKGIKLHLNIARGFPQFVKTDPTRLRQILINLIGNAIKFTEHGEVVVTAEVERSTGNPSVGHLKFTIVDSGIGISPEQKERLFKPFSQADSSMTRKFGGSGLGLALAQELARALEGGIAITQTQIGIGTTFVCYVGVSEITNANEPTTIAHESHTAPPGSALKGLSILLVEDSPDNQLLFSRYLKNAGAQVEFADHGRAGIEKALRGAHDLVLMDIQMPILNGHDATAELRKCGYGKPIIALTAHALKEERDRAFLGGFTDYLTKPLNRVSLIESILRVIEP